MATTRKTPSNSPAAVRARERRAADRLKRDQEQQAAGGGGGDGLYDPDQGKADDAPAGRGPGAPVAAYRRPSLTMIAANLIALPNAIVSRVFPRDALSKQETALLARGLVRDPFTGPYLARMATVGVHSDLIEAVTMIVMGRLIEHGLMPFGFIEEMMKVQQQGEAANDDDDTIGVSADDDGPGTFGGPGQPGEDWAWPEPPVPVAAG